MNRYSPSGHARNVVRSALQDGAVVHGEGGYIDNVMKSILPSIGSFLLHGFPPAYIWRGMPVSTSVGTHHMGRDAPELVPIRPYLPRRCERATRCSRCCGRTLKHVTFTLLQDGISPLVRKVRRRNERRLGGQEIAVVSADTEHQAALILSTSQENL